MTPLEKINSMKMPFAELKGVAFTEAGKDRVVARMLVRPDLCTTGHIIHGGAIMALADSPCTPRNGSIAACTSPPSCFLVDSALRNRDQVMMHLTTDRAAGP